MSKRSSLAIPVAGLVALLAGACAVLLAEAWGHPSPIDDAFISYRYARNLVEGMGLVYNPGEYVEGYTNLSWTLLVAGALALGAKAVSAGFWLGQASAFAALAATTALARALLRDWPLPVAALAPWLVLATPDFVRWSASGMETSLFTALVTGALAAFAWGRVGTATACAALATLTRPDGVLVAAVILAWHLAPRLRDPRAWRPLGAFAAFVALLTLFRLGYYGDPLPNTFYAKVGDTHWDRGAEYVRSLFASGPWLLLPLAVAAWLRAPACRPGGAYAAVVCLYVVAIGGDAFAWRFLMPIVPWLAVASLWGVLHAWRAGPFLGLVATGLLAASVSRQSLGMVPWLPLLAAALVAGGAVLAWRGSSPRVRAGWALAGIALAGALLAARPSSLAEFGDALVDPARGRELARLQKIDAGMIQVGRLMSAKLRGDPREIRLVATGAIGAFGWFSRLPVLDLYGLVDPVIARSRGRAEALGVEGLPGHERSDADYVLERRPDYILIPRKPEGAGARGGAGRPATLDLWAHPDLERLYRWDERMSAYRLRSLGPVRARPRG